MLKKDRKAIADIIKVEYTRFDNSGENDYEGQHATTCIAQNIANYISVNNSYFSRQKFLDDCGIEQ